jgi:hypothetical protein
MGAGLFHADGQTQTDKTDRHYETNSRFLRNFATVSAKYNFSGHILI